MIFWNKGKAISLPGWREDLGRLAQVLTALVSVAGRNRAAPLDHRIGILLPAQIEPWSGATRDEPGQPGCVECRDIVFEVLAARKRRAPAIIARERA